MTGVLFDVDGTLVDSTYLHVTCWAEAFAQHDVEVTSARLHGLIGMAADRLVHEVTRGAGEQLVADLKAAHSTLYAQHYGHLRPLPGARELLRGLAPVVLVSSASGPELEALRAALDCDDAIKAATSGDEVDRGKPAPDLVQRGLELLGTDDAVFVGDAVWDGEACRQAAIPFVGLRSGGIPDECLWDAGALELYDTPQHLLDGLGSSILGRVSSA